MDSYVVEVQNNGAIRRLTLGIGEKKFSYEQLQSRIRDIFQLPASAEFGVTYIDRDGDVVTMVEDEDLRDALVLQKLNPLRITIENLQEGTNDVKISSSSFQAEVNSDEQQQPRQGDQIAQILFKSLPVDPVANAEPVVNTGEDSTVPEEKDWTIIDEAPGSNSSDATSPASGTSVDAVKVDLTANAEPVINSDEKSTALEEKVSTIVGEVPDSSPSDSFSPASSTSVDATRETSPGGATTTEKKSLEAEEAKKDNLGHQFHFGVQCDGCGMSPITGPRFKSCKKLNYDLCLKCYEANGAEENEYVKIDLSVYRIGCPAYAARIFGRPHQRMCRRPDQCRKLTPDSEVSATAATTGESENKAAGTEDSTPVLHQGVQCDECGMVPIEGPRFRSSTRFNYDLCRNCFEKSGSNARKYTRIDQPFIRRGPHPLTRRHLMRWSSPHHLQQPLSTRWVWVLNQLVPVVAADQVVAEEKTPAAGSDVMVGEDALDKSRAESAAVKGEVDTTPSASKQEEGATKERAESAKVERNVVQIPVIWADKTEAASSSSTPETLSAEKGVVNSSVKTGGVKEKAVEASSAAEGDLSTQEGLLAKLAAIGFEDPKLNVELLEKNSFDLRKTLDDLCSAEEWDPILGELQEMGFYDASLNRRIMFNHNGSVKRVVKELVEMYKGEKLA